MPSRHKILVQLIRRGIQYGYPKGYEPAPIRLHGESGEKPADRGAERKIFGEMGKLSEHRPECDHCLLVFLAALPVSGADDLQNFFRQIIAGISRFFAVLRGKPKNRGGKYKRKNKH